MCHVSCSHRIELSGLEDGPRHFRCWSKRCIHQVLAPLNPAGFALVAIYFESTSLDSAKSSCLFPVRSRLFYWASTIGAEVLSMVVVLFRSLIGPETRS